MENFVKLLMNLITAAANKFEAHHYYKLQSNFHTYSRIE